MAPFEALVVSTFGDVSFFKGESGGQSCRLIGEYSRYSSSTSADSDQPFGGSRSSQEVSYFCLGRREADADPSSTAQVNVTPIINGYIISSKTLGWKWCFWLIGECCHFAGVGRHLRC